MKQYQYQIEHSVGQASGTVEAKSQKEAKQKLTEQYVTKYKDGDGKEHTVKVKKIVLNELGE